MVHPSVAQCGQLRLKIYDFVFSSEKKNQQKTPLSHNGTHIITDYCKMAKKWSEKTSQLVPPRDPIKKR